MLIRRMNDKLRRPTGNRGSHRYLGKRGRCHGRRANRPQISVSLTCNLVEQMKFLPNDSSVFSRVCNHHLSGRTLTGSKRPTGRHFSHQRGTIANKETLTAIEHTVLSGLHLNRSSPIIVREYV